MSDDDRPRGGKGGKGKGGKDGGGKGGKGGGGGGGGGPRDQRKADRDGEARGPAVSRLKVLPKFLQAMMRDTKPAEDKRGLADARLNDKTSGLGRNDDDEYDVEGACIVDSDYTADDVRVFGQYGKKGAAHKEEAPKQKANGFFLTEAPKVEEENKGPMTFKTKIDRSAAGSGGGKHKGVGAGGTGKADPSKSGKAADEDSDGGPRITMRRGRGRSPSPKAKAKPGVKKQKLSFGDDVGNDDSEDE